MDFSKLIRFGPTFVQLYCAVEVEIHVVALREAHTVKRYKTAVRLIPGIELKPLSAARHPSRKLAFAWK